MLYNCSRFLVNMYKKRYPLTSPNVNVSNPPSVPSVGCYLIFPCDFVDQSIHWNFCSPATPNQPVHPASPTYSARRCSRHCTVPQHYCYDVYTPTRTSYLSCHKTYATQYATIDPCKCELCSRTHLRPQFLSTCLRHTTKLPVNSLHLAAHFPAPMSCAPNAAH